MSKWKRLQQRAVLSFKGAMSESNLCIDCGFNTAPACLNRAEAEREAGRQIARGKIKWSIPQAIDSQSEVYMVFDHVWEAAGMTDWSGVLCVGCLEKRIGRRLRPGDFTDHVFNSMPCTPRLAERQGRYDPLGELEAIINKFEAAVDARRAGH